MNSNTIQKRSSWAQIIPVMFCFFAMGFVDLVGTASNYLKEDLSLSDTMANVFPSLVFFWFLIFSVPTGILMNKIGRKKTVLISLIVTCVSLIIPCLGNDFITMLIAFSLLGIGNALMQTSLNPLVSNLISGDKLASTLTFGQFVKAIASFLTPVIIAWGSAHAATFLGLGWHIIFFIYAIVSFLTIAILGATPITEEQPDKASGFVECIKLLGRPFILLCFIGIMCHVGIDVGTNFTSQRLLQERVHLTREEATIATFVYFIARTVGCLLGGFILRMMSPKKFFGFSVIMMLAAMIMLFFVTTQTALFIGIAMIGFGNSNIFSVIFAQSLIHSPKEKNEVSGLMIMGLFGGTIFPLGMGYASKIFGQAGAVAVMTIGVLYLLFYTFKIRAAKS